MANTKKPCPGCGKVSRERAADKVCYACAKDLAEIAQIRADAERVRATVENTLLTKTEPCAIYIRDRLYQGGERSYKAPEYQTWATQTILLLRALAEPLDRGRVPSQWNFSSHAFPTRCDHNLTLKSKDFSGVIEVSAQASTVGKNWWNATEKLWTAVYNNGVDDGRDLLAQLASGSMTMDQVNQRGLEITRRAR